MCKVSAYEAQTNVGVLIHFCFPQQELRRYKGLVFHSIFIFIESGNMFSLPGYWVSRFSFFIADIFLFNQVMFSLPGYWFFNMLFPEMFENLCTCNTRCVYSGAKLIAWTMNKYLEYQES